MKKILLIIILLFINPTISNACSCAWNTEAEPTRKEIFDQYDKILIWNISQIKSKKINIKKWTLSEKWTYDTEVKYYFNILKNIKWNYKKDKIIIKDIEKKFTCNCSNYYNPLKEWKIGDIFSLYVKWNLNKKDFFPERYNKKYRSVEYAKVELLNLKNKSKIYFKFMSYKEKFNLEYNWLLTRNTIKTIILILLSLTIFKMFKYYNWKVLKYIYLISICFIFLGMFYILFIDNNLISRYDYWNFQAYSMLFYLPLALYLLFFIYKKRKIIVLIIYTIIIIFYYLLLIL